MKVEHLKQGHRFGCIPACLSMITGIPYNEIVNDLGGRFDDESMRGMTFHDADFWLAERGYAISRKWKFKRGNIKAEPWPPLPWTDVHLVLVAIHGGSHGVVLLRDGTVLDPMKDSPCNLTDYEDVHQVYGVHNLIPRRS